MIDIVADNCRLRLRPTGSGTCSFIGRAWRIAPGTLGMSISEHSAGSCHPFSSAPNPPTRPSPPLHPTWNHRRMRMAMT